MPKTVQIIAIVALIAVGTCRASAAMPTGAQADWKTYRSDTYGFTIQYPPFLEPLEGRAMFFFGGGMDSPGGNNGLKIPLGVERVRLRLCFAPTTRLEFYCEVELYVVPADLVPYRKIMSDFLGFPLCPPEKIKARKRPQFDDLQGTEIDTCGEAGYHRNAFVQKGDLVYLLTTEPAIGYGVENPGFFDDMLRSFRWLEIVR